ncbi:ABC transporter ATP-binding protein [Janibacter melonis]|uniref:ABC transporter ATP-binding protein n=1 Tax=Janibacter melonis TaxID=262209 RepID=UPI001785AF25|nr:ABC transporter ATP-binding protein [Janibacter melonis]
MAVPTTPSGNTALVVEDLEVRYGTIPALRGLSLEVRRGSLTTLLGANGAGKSTTLNTVAGLQRPRSGRVVFDGQDITGVPAHRTVRRGLALVPEGRMVVAPLTVLENLQLSAYARGRRQASLGEVWEMFPRLADRKSQPAGLMSGGEQQMLAIARAWMTKPAMVLLDEPSMGLSPALVDVVVEAITTIHAAGATVLLVEQNASIALPMSDHAYLIHRGDIVASGTPSEIDADPDLVARHLGLDPEIAGEEIEVGAAPTGGAR